MTIPDPTETSYAGYRFRSRTEARWAVAFTEMGIDWRYEVEGYKIGPNKRPYLPDFWLPDFGAWVEVKGSQEGLDLKLLDDAVRTEDGLPGSDANSTKCLIILGPVPEPTGAYTHWMLSRPSWIPAGCEHFCLCHDIRYSQVTFRSIPWRMDPAKLADLPGDLEVPASLLMEVSSRTPMPTLTTDFVTPMRSGWIVPDLGVCAAMKAARSARFEHGEMPLAPGEKPMTRTVAQVIAKLRENRGESA